MDACRISGLPRRATGGLAGLLAVLFGLLAVMLGGCAGVAVERGTEPIFAVPQQWSSPLARADAPGDSAAQRAHLAAWWRQFADPQLDALMQQAMRANPSMGSARQAVLAARAQLAAQRGTVGPGIGASASARRSQPGTGSGSNALSAAMDASWEWDLFGRQTAGLRASAAELASSEAALQAAHVSLAAEVALAYVDLRNQQQRLHIARANLASQQETLQIVQWRLEAGLTTTLALEQARGGVAQTQAQIPALEAGVTRARHTLAVLTGQPPAALDETLAASSPLPEPPARLALRFPAETLAQRPDVRAAMQRVHAALARVDEADAARFPTLRLSGSLGLAGATLGALGHSAAWATSAASSLSASLFDGGAARARVRAQLASLEQARLAWHGTVLAALQEVEDALAQLQGDLLRLEHLQVAAASAAAADLLARQRHASGLVDFQTVLDTQRSLLSTQDSVANARASVLGDHVRLYRALGGGWTPEDADVPEPPDPFAPAAPVTPVAAARSPISAPKP